MGRFDSPAQVVALFVAASLVSVGLIFLISAEQQSRLQAEHRTSDSPQMGVDVRESVPDQTAAPSPVLLGRKQMTLLNYFQDGVGKLLRALPFRHREPPLISRTERRKRSSRNSAHTYTNNNHLLVLDGDNSEEPGTTNGHPRTQGTEFHKIRHAMKRLGGGGLDGDVVLRMILDSNPIPPDTPTVHHRPLEYHHSPDTPHHSRRRPESAETEHLPRSVHQKGFVRTSSTEQFHQPNERRERHYEEPFSKMAPFTSPMVTAEDPVHFLQTPTPVAITEQGSLDSLERKPVDSYVGWSNGTVGGRSHGHATNRSSILVENLDICYKTDDVLIVILLTCCLNFTFVLLIWACVKWFSAASKEKDFHHLDCEGGESMVFPQDSEDLFWSTNGGSRKVKNGKTRGLTSASLYTFRPDYVPQQILRRSYSYSMEDLRYVHT